MLDVIVIGAGPAGVLSALRAADLGARNSQSDALCKRLGVSSPLPVAAGLVSGISVQKIRSAAVETAAYAWSPESFPFRDAAEYG